MSADTDAAPRAGRRWVPWARPVSPVPLIAAAVVVVLLARAGGYGYHRDELYFLAAGRHPSWSYPDQGPVTPLIAAAMSHLSATSLTVLRVPSALMAGGIVMLTGGLAREFGGTRRAQWLAAACAATSSIVLFDGHLLSTSTFDLLVWTAAGLLAVRAVRTGDDRIWPLVGIVLGLGLLNKPLPAFLALGLLAGVAIAGPRRVLRSRWLWAGALIAVALWSPWLVWQAAHGWPQLTVSRSIAAGGSASSQPWWAVVPFQFLLVSPVLAPVWIAGLVRLLADPTLRDLRFVGCAWVLLAVVFMAAGGKPYYLAGLLPALLGAGAPAIDRWLGRSTARRAWLAGALAVSAAINAVIALPILPAGRAGPVVAVNTDVGETIGWPDLVRTVARVRRSLPAGTPVVVLTANYGEAGAIDRYGPPLGLPGAYSGHNAYGEWGPPPDRPPGQRVITVGLPATPYLRDCRLVTRIGDHAGIDNAETGAPVQICAAPAGPWRRLWPHLRHYG